MSSASLRVVWASDRGLVSACPGNPGKQIAGLRSEMAILIRYRDGIFAPLHHPPETTQGLAVCPGHFQSGGNRRELYIATSMSDDLYADWEAVDRCGQAENGLASEVKGPGKPD